MVSIRLLDKTLNYIESKEIFGLIEEDIPHFTQVENEYLFQAVKRLEKDGYVYAEHKDEYMLTFDGIVALHQKFLFNFEGRPYERMRAKEDWKDAWMVVKFLAVALNAIALLVLAILTFKYKT